MKHSMSIRYTDRFLKVEDNRFAQYILLIHSYNPITKIYITV